VKTNIALVREWVAKVERLKADAEAAHGEEDDLYAAVLRLIANQVEDDPVGLCREALKTKLIGFPRWCA